MRNAIVGFALVCALFVGTASAQCPGGNCSAVRSGVMQRNFVAQDYVPYVYQDQFGVYQGFKATKPTVYGKKPVRTTFFRIFAR